MPEVIRLYDPRPPASFLRTVSNILSMPDDNLRAINEWARQNTLLLLDIDRQQIRSASMKLGISYTNFVNVTQILSSIVTRRAIKGLSIEDVISEFKELELEEERAQKLSLLLEGIEVSKEDAERSSRITWYTQLAIPVIQDVEVMCDLRAIFQASPSPDISDEHQNRLKNLLGWAPVIIMSLDIMDEAGHESAVVFQLDERGYKNFMKALQDGGLQLEATKQSISRQLPRNSTSQE